MKKSLNSYVGRYLGTPHLRYLFVEKHFDILHRGEGVRVRDGEIRLQAGVGGHREEGAAGLQRVPGVALGAGQEGGRVVALVPAKRHIRTYIGRRTKEMYKVRTGTVPYQKYPILIFDL